MESIITFSFIKGTNKESCVIDFENRKITLCREGFKYVTNGLINMEFGFDQITGIERAPKSLFKNEQYQLILDNKRLCAVDNLKTTVTIFNLSKKDIKKANAVMQRLCKECKIREIKKLGKINAPNELYQYQYSPDLIEKSSKNR